MSDEDGSSSNAVPTNKGLRMKMASTDTMQEDDQTNGDERVRDMDWLISPANEVEEPPQPGSNTHMQKVPAWMLNSQQFRKEHFNPEVMALGPFRHGESNLKQLQEIKVIAFRAYVDFMASAYNCSKRDAAEFLFFNVKEAIDEASRCYPREITGKFGPEAFTRMMMLDGYFILRFIEYANENKFGSNISEHQVPLIVRDMFLLENQIPFTVLRALSKVIYGSEDAIRDRIFQFIHRWILFPSFYSLTGRSWLSYDGMRRQLVSEWDDVAHLLDVLRVILLGKRKDDRASRKKRSDAIPRHMFGSVIELKNEGIRFANSGAMHLMNIEFQKNWFFPEILLPPIVITRTTVCYILNMIALEQHLNIASNHSITAYACFLNSIINHAADVEELRLRGVLYHALGSDAEVAEVWNRWPIETTVDLQVHSDVIHYISDRRSKWWKISIARFWYAHFRSAWLAFSWYAAVTLLFAALQTIFGIIHRG